MLVWYCFVDLRKTHETPVSDNFIIHRKNSIPCLIFICFGSPWAPSPTARQHKGFLIDVCTQSGCFTTVESWTWGSATFMVSGNKPALYPGENVSSSLKAAANRPWEMAWIKCALGPKLFSCSAVTLEILKIYGGFLSWSTFKIICPVISIFWTLLPIGTSSTYEDKMLI